jgi:hypothetical protein
MSMGHLIFRWSQFKGPRIRYFKLMKMFKPKLIEKKLSYTRINFLSEEEKMFIEYYILFIIDPREMLFISR